MRNVLLNTCTIIRISLGKVGNLGREGEREEGDKIRKKTGSKAYSTLLDCWIGILHMTGNILSKTCPLLIAKDFIIKCTNLKKKINNNNK